MIKNITLFIVALFITVLLSEILLRAVDYNYSPMKIEEVNKNDWREVHAFKDDHFVYDPNLIWRPKKSSSVINSQGYRGEELDVKKEGEFRIFAIGDSNTLGWIGEKDAPNWPMYLEDLLQESGAHIKVINAGAYGYSSFQGLRRFKGTLSYKPDMVLISFGGNDAHQVAFSDKEYLDRSKKLSLYSKLLKFRLGNLFIAFLDKVALIEKNDGKKKTVLVPRVSIEEYKNNLNEIVKISKENNIICILLTRSYIGDSPDELWWKNYAPAYKRATFEIAESTGIPVVDVYTYFKDKEIYFVDESHFNKMGHMIAAALIYENISSTLPGTSKGITLSDYLERIAHDFNNTKTIIPEKINSNLKNFSDYYWTSGNSMIFDIRYDVKQHDNFLVLNTFGWNPYRNDLERLKLKVITNGINLEFSHKDGNAYYFNLDKNLEQINRIQITSSTFVPKDLGINNDPRRLGIDIASIEIK